MIHLTSFLFIITEVQDSWFGEPWFLRLKSIGPGDTTRFVSIEEYWGTGDSCMSDQSSVQACFGVLVTPFDWFCSHNQHFKLICGSGTKTFWTLIIGNIEWDRIVLDNNLSAWTIVNIVWTNDAVSGFLVSEINTKYKLNISKWPRGHRTMDRCLRPSTYVTRPSLSPARKSLPQADFGKETKPVWAFVSFTLACWSLTKFEFSPVLLTLALPDRNL